MITRIVRHQSLISECWYTIDYKFLFLWHRVPLSFTKIEAARFVRAKIDAGLPPTSIPTPKEEVYE